MPIKCMLCKFFHSYVQSSRYYRSAAGLQHAGGNNPVVQK